MFSLTPSYQELVGTHALAAKFLLSIVCVEGCEERQMRSPNELKSRQRQRAIALSGELRQSIYDRG
jgi:hypothetical protein